LREGEVELSREMCIKENETHCAGLAVQYVKKNETVMKIRGETVQKVIEHNSRMTERENAE
jgi:predicted ATP-dependent protease